MPGRPRGRGRTGGGAPQTAAVLNAARFARGLKVYARAAGRHGAFTLASPPSCQV